MKALLTDPVVIICAAAILFGVVGSLWTIGKLKNSKSAPREPDILAMDDVGGTDLPPVDIAPIRSPMREPITPVSRGPVDKEVADQLRDMSSRLVEMQSVLNKQAAPNAATGGAAGIGQGFSPETVDKLLKIIGNVIQQVDILQKSMNLSKDSGHSVSPVAGGMTAPKPMSVVPPSAAPAPKL